MTDSPIPAYPKVWNLGHNALIDLFDGPVVVQEKVDGSQLSWMLKDDELHVRSKGAVIRPENLAPEDMFYPSVQTILRARDSARLVPDAVYRGEALRSSKHNTIKYSRAPEGNIALFDVELSPAFIPEGLPTGSWATPAMLHLAATELECEAVPTYPFNGIDEDRLTIFRRILEQESFLGGSLIEGVVIKNYWRFDPRSGKTLMGKFVSEAFKETHKREWGASNPSRTDVVDRLIEELRQPTRWAKAVQHLEEAGELENSPRDIGKIFTAAKADLVEEEGEYIAMKLREWAMPKILRGATAGLAEWYKEQLVERQFS
jgi:hypothetical protein